MIVVNQGFYFKGYKNGPGVKPQNMDDNFTLKLTVSNETKRRNSCRPHLGNSTIVSFVTGILNMVSVLCVRYFCDGYPLFCFI